MREIKFRAWDKNAKQFVEQFDYVRYSDGTLGVKDSTPPFNKHGEIVLMQYTGLKDKLGVEIFEGDIVTTGNGLVRLVTWDAPGFWLAKNPTDRVDVDSFSTPGSYEEVIGNIYSNPELLGGTDDTTNTPAGAEKE